MCGDLTFAGSSDTLGGACANVDGSPCAGISVGTDGGVLLFGATPGAATSVSIEQTGADPITAPTVASNDASIALRWFVVEVGDSKKVTAIIGHDANGAEVFRLAQPLGPPYPDTTCSTGPRSATSCPAPSTARSGRSSPPTRRSATAPARSRALTLTFASRDRR